MTGRRRVFRGILVGWFLVPLVPLALWAFANRWPFPARFPQEFGFDGVRTALDSGAVHAALLSTALGVAVAAVATPVGALAARALASGRVVAPRLVQAMLLSPLVLPAFAVALGLDVVVLRLRVPGAAAVVVILAVAALPYTTTVMGLAFGAYDVAYEEEARTLGASRWTVALRIRLPLLAPAISGAAFLAFLVAWSDYVVTLLIGGGRLITLPMLVGSFAAGTGNESVVAVLSLAAILPPLILLIVVARFRGRREVAR